MAKTAAQRALPVLLVALLIALAFAGGLVTTPLKRLSVPLFTAAVCLSPPLLRVRARARARARPAMLISDQKTYGAGAAALAVEVLLETDRHCDRLAGR